MAKGSSDKFFVPLQKTMKINVRVITGARENKVVPQVDSSLRVYSTALPVEGRANQALVKILAKEYGVAKSRIEILKGHKSRNKVVEIT